MIDENVEKYIGVKLPKEYKDFIQYNVIEVNNGNLIKLHGKNINIRAFLGFDKNDDFYILNVYNEIRDILLDDLIPIAITEFDEYICLDYKNGRNAFPKVVYYDSELAILDANGAVFNISNSFSEFLELVEFKQ